MKKREKPTTAIKSKGARPPSEPPIEIGTGDGSLSWMPADRGDRIVLTLSALGLAAVVYLLAFFNPRSGPGDSPVVGQLRTESAVRRRHARTLHWHDLKGADAVYLRDIVYTPAGAFAIVTFPDGRTLELKPDTMVQFDEITVDGIQITLFDFGLFRLIPYPRVKRSDLLPDPRPLELRQAEYSQRLQERLKAPLGLGRLRKVYEFQFALNRLSDYLIVLVRPENQVYDLRANRWLQAIWSPVPVSGARQELQVGTDPRFKSFLTHRPRDNKLLMQFEKAGTYFWRVKVTQDENEILSQPGSFVFAESRGLKKRIIMAPAAPGRNSASQPDPTRAQP